MSKNVANNVANEKVQDYVKKSHILTENKPKTEKTARDVQKNCLSLTEQWKKGGLKKDKKYYTKDKLGRTYIKTYNKKGFKGLVEEVLCEVPSYEKWKNITNTLDYEYKGNLILREKNAKLNERIEKLEELLYKCYRFLRLTETNVKAIEEVKQDIVKQIDEVLK